MTMKPWWNRRTPTQIERLKLRLCLLAMIGGGIGMVIGLYSGSYGWVTVSCAVLALGVFSFD